MSSKVEGIAPEELDELVDEGKENVLQYFDLDNLRRGDSKRINIDLPIEFLAALDRQAVRRGITRQSLIKVWLFDRLESVDDKHKDISEALKAAHSVKVKHLAASHPSKKHGEYSRKYKSKATTERK
jgi:hypothetical protein